MRIIKNTITVGAAQPFTLLHMTDTHLTRTDTADAARTALGRARRDTLFPTAEEEMAFVRQYQQQTGYPLVHTGDLVDFLTPENLAAAKDFAEQTDLLFVAGNHEIHTCPNNVFCEADFTEDLHNKARNLADTNQYFRNDIDFFCREIHGILLVGINTYDYQISAQNFEKLRALEQQKKPMVLFMHIPLYEEPLYTRTHGALLAMPPAALDNASDFVLFEQQADAVTAAAAEHIRRSPYVAHTVCGHLHFDYESPDGVAVPQFVTGLGTLREITVR